MTDKNDKIQRLGWDPGFGTNNAAMVVDGQMVTTTVSSIVGVGTVNGALNLAGFDSHRQRDQLHQITFEDGTNYLVGDDVASYTKPLERMDYARFFEGTDIRALFYTTLSQLDLMNGSQIAVAIGLPVEMLKGKNRAEVAQKVTSIEEEMGRWLLGPHQFMVNGREMGIEVSRFRANVAQPLGAWLDWGLDNDGEWIRGPEGRTTPTLILDQGFNTFDIFGVEDGRPSTRFTAGDTLGMRRVAEMIRSNVQRRHGVHLGLHQADLLLRKLLANEAPVDYVHGQTVDLTPEINQALHVHVADVLQFVDDVVGKEAFKFKILLAGNGILALAARLQRQYAHAELACQPGLAIVRGLAKAAVSRLFMK